MLSNYGNFHPVKKNGIPSSKAASSACEKGNKWLLALEMLRMAKDRKPAPDFPAFSQMKYAWYMDEFSRDIKRKKPSIEYSRASFPMTSFHGENWNCHGISVFGCTLNWTISWTHMKRDSNGDMACETNLCLNEDIYIGYDLNITHQPYDIWQQSVTNGDINQQWYYGLSDQKSVT